MDRVVLFFCFLKPCWCLLVMSTSFNEFSSNIHFSISFSKILYLGPFCAMGILLLPTIVLKFCFGWRLFQKVRLGVFLKFQHHPLIFFGGSYHILHCFYFILMSFGLSNFLTFDLKGVESQNIKVLPLYTLSLIVDEVTTFFTLFDKNLQILNFLLRFWLHWKILFLEWNWCCSLLLCWHYSKGFFELPGLMPLQMILDLLLWKKYLISL